MQRGPDGRDLPVVQQYANIRAHGFGKRGQQVTERLRTVVQRSALMRSCGIVPMVDIHPARLFGSRVSVLVLGGARRKRGPGARRD